MANNTDSGQGLQPLEMVIYRLDKLEDKLDADIKHRFERLEAAVERLQTAYTRATAIGAALLIIWPYVWPLIQAAFSKAP